MRKKNMSLRGLLEDILSEYGEDNMTGHDRAATTIGKVAIDGMFPNVEEAGSPMLNKPKPPSHPAKTHPTRQTPKPENDREKQQRAAASIKITKDKLKIARTPAQRTSLQRRAAEQQKRLTKMKTKKPS